MFIENERKARNSRFLLTAATMIVALVTLLSAAPTDVRAQGQLSPADLLRRAAGANNGDNEVQPPNPLADSLQRLGGTDKPNSDPIAGFGAAPFDLAMLGPLFEPSESARTKKGPVLRQLAEEYFLAGNQSSALQLMFGHMAAEYEDAAETLLAVKYSSLLKRPIWNVRFGVSMWVRSSGADGQDPSPIPAEGSSNGTPRVGFPSGAGNLSAGIPTNSGDDSVQRDRLAAALGGLGRRSQTSNRPSGRSPGAANLGAKGPAIDAAEPNPDSENPSIQATPEPLDDGKMLSDVAIDELDRHLGLVAQVVGEEFNTRYSRGDFGPLLIGLKVPEPKPSSPAQLLSLQAVSAESAPQEKKRASPSSRDSLRMWNPGIVYLGNAATKDILKKAKSEHIDVVIHFEVALKAGRGDTIQNASRVRLINVSTGKSIGVSKTMDSNEESQLAPKGTGGRDYVNEQLENLLAILDRDIKVVELPKLTPEIARRRLATLLGSDSDQSLRTLAEIRLYQKQQLLTPEEVEMAFDIVGGSESLILLYGSTEERIEMARQWASKQTLAKSKS